MRTRASGERGAVAAIVRSTVEEAFGSGSVGTLPSRVAALEDGAHGLRSQLEVQAQLQDRHSALLSAVEDQVRHSHHLRARQGLCVKAERMCCCGGGQRAYWRRYAVSISIAACVL